MLRAINKPNNPKRNIPWVCVALKGMVLVWFWDPPPKGLGSTATSQRNVCADFFITLSLFSSDVPDVDISGRLCTRLFWKSTIKVVVVFTRVVGTLRVVWKHYSSTFCFYYTTWRLRVQITTKMSANMRASSGTGLTGFYQLTVSPKVSVFFVQTKQAI